MSTTEILDDDSLTVHERALLEARLAAYAKDPDAGSTWAEVEDRIRTVLGAGRTDESASNRHSNI